MLPKLLLTIRTANRAPKRNYLDQTVLGLMAKGVSDFHIFATDPDVSWLPAWLEGDRRVHVPDRRLTPNQNGLAPIALLDDIEADWIILSEDDVFWCADPVGSMARWLSQHARPDVVVYRFFAFDHLHAEGLHVASAPLREQKGSQVIALRAADAKRLATWAKAHPLDWRPRTAPFRHRPHDGFDKLVGYWALQDTPETTYGLVSRPFFVDHIGVESSLHAYGKQLRNTFAGDSWSYPEAESCHP